MFTTDRAGRENKIEFYLSFFQTKQKKQTKKKIIKFIV